MYVRMVRMVSCASVDPNLLGYSKVEHRSGSNRFNVKAMFNAY